MMDRHQFMRRVFPAVSQKGGMATWQPGGIQEDAAPGRSAALHLSLLWPLVALTRIVHKPEGSIAPLRAQFLQHFLFRMCR